MTTYASGHMTELMIPRNPEEARHRVEGFYTSIGWGILHVGEFETAVYPPIRDGRPPALPYWQTTSADKLAEFAYNDSDDPSPFARGLHLGRIWKNEELCLVLPTDEDVLAITHRGGELLASHTFEGPVEHCGAINLRIQDPYGYSLRITPDPGWAQAPAFIAGVSINERG